MIGRLSATQFFVLIAWMKRQMNYMELFYIKERLCSNPEIIDYVRSYHGSFITNSELFLDIDMKTDDAFIIFC